MKESIINWLLEEENPSVRFFTLTSLIGKSSADPAVRKARKNIMEHGVVPIILEKQNDDGSWGDPDRFYRDKYRGAAWTLLILAEMAADPENKRIKNACEFILKNSQDPESGGFSFDRSAKTGTGIPGGVVPCLTGNMVYALIKLGYLEDPRVGRAIEWITTYQRADDADIEGPEGKVYDRYKMCWGSHSCHMGVAKAFKALAAIPAHKRSKKVNCKIEEIAEYFLKHHIYKKSHNLDEISRPGWLKLGFPLMYQTDVLELLGIFADLKIGDDRLRDALDIVKAKEMKDGKWKLESSFNGKMLANIEKKGEPSKWITLKALRVLFTSCS
ncbi:MAG: prenyltransferase/squalene oxidase repeat-containing protein [Clostridiaceae bacterium]